MSISEQARWFSEHVHPHEAALRAYLSKRFPALPDHDDLVQETYARLMRVDDPSRLAHPKAFLFTTARNAAIDFFRRRNKYPHDSLGTVEGLTALPLRAGPPRPWRRSSDANAARRSRKPCAPSPNAAGR